MPSGLDQVTAWVLARHGDVYRACLTALAVSGLACWARERRALAAHDHADHVRG